MTPPGSNGGAASVINLEPIPDIKSMQCVMGMAHNIKAIKESTAYLQHLILYLGIYETTGIIIIMRVIYTAP